jgi:hypothetical protein
MRLLETRRRCAGSSIDDAVGAVGGYAGGDVVELGQQA